MNKIIIHMKIALKLPDPHFYFAHWDGWSGTEALNVRWQQTMVRKLSVAWHM